ncbi:TAXI family TRAP transporter solute-binding subunit [Fodinicurvata sp. EGI_FJ10296]|uniref:TAXI family TRAP transporter solute-binding subunit n=1 Tax=Fodinicurvata sp. EGI_FJ10296 TaxID=3231908 RepID=UPI0034516A0D
MATALAIGGLAIPGAAAAEDEALPPAEQATETGPGSGETVSPVVSIASGMPNGLYFPVAGSVAQILDASGSFDGTTFAAESTTGSWENVVRVNAGEFDFGIARSDRVFEAVMGIGPFADSGPLGDLRLLMALHDEPLTIIARNDFAADDFSDLGDARINLGPDEHNAMRVAMTAALEAAGMIPEAGQEGDDAGADGEEAGPTLLSLPLGTQHEALCAGEVDVIAYIAGHPTGTVHEAVTACEARIIGIGPEIVETVLSAHPYYKASSIPSGYYRDTAVSGAEDVAADEPAVPTFGPVALMVSHAGVDDAMAESVTAVIVEGIEALRNVHPALANLSITEILGSEFSAPLHDGALEFFRERGIQ